MTILKIGTDFHLGKNLYLIDNLISTGSLSTIASPYRYFRLSDTTGASKCELVEIKIFGWKTSEVVESAGDLTCPLSVQVNGSAVSTLTSSVVYTAALTYIVKSVAPNYGDVSGSTPITITLDKAITDAVTVTIDGVVCASPVASSMTITCTTGLKSTTASSSLIVTVNGNTAVNNGVLFYYGSLWSADATWNGDFAPIDGDLISVGAGKTLIVDVPYIGVLNTVILD